MEPDVIDSIQGGVPEKRLLGVKGEQPQEDKSGQEQALVSQLGYSQVGGGEDWYVGDDSGEGEDGHKAAEPTSDNGVALALDVWFDERERVERWEWRRVCAGIEGFEAKEVEFWWWGSEEQRAVTDREWWWWSDEVERERHVLYMRSEDSDILMVEKLLSGPPLQHRWNKN